MKKSKTETKWFKMITDKAYARRIVSELTLDEEAEHSFFFSGVRAPSHSHTLTDLFTDELHRLEAEIGKWAKKPRYMVVTCECVGCGYPIVLSTHSTREAAERWIEENENTGPVTRWVHDNGPKEDRDW